MTGSGFEIREHATMRLGEDPRRVDLHRSARDPMQRLWVRRMQQTSTTNVTVLADVSASVAVSGHGDKYQMLLQFIQSAARSAGVNGDRFGLHCGDHLYRPAISLEARRRALLSVELVSALRSFKPTGSSAIGLLAAADKIKTGRGLVFLVSDFYWPLELIEQLSQALWHTQLVPVMLCDSAELQPQSSCLSNVRDAETGREMLRFRWPWRPSDHTASVAAHRLAVADAFARHGAQVLTLEDRFDANLVSAYFYS